MSAAEFERAFRTSNALPHHGEHFKMSDAGLVRSVICAVEDLCAILKHQSPRNEGEGARRLLCQKAEQ